MSDKKKTKIVYGIGREIDDEEKAILPALIFCKLNVGNKWGWAISLGWWDFYIRIGFIYLTKH